MDSLTVQRDSLRAFINESDMRKREALISPEKKAGGSAG